MKLNSIITSAAFAASVFGSPTPSPPDNGETGCSPGDGFTAGPYTVSQNFLDAASATSGSQCTTLISENSGTVSWSTSWSWEGAPDVIKSFANAGLTQSGCPKISSILSISTKWQWSYTGAEIVADVAYNLFTSSTDNGKSEFQISIWIGTFGGAAPMSTTGSAIEFPLIDGSSYELFQGTNGDITVFTFVADDNNEDFNADVNDFLKHLVQFEQLSDQQLLTSIGAGTETFTGSNSVFTVQAYSLDIQ